MKRTLFAVFVLLFLSQSTIAAPPLEAYGRLPGVEMMQLSPSGKRYALIGVVDNVRRFAVATDKNQMLMSGELGNTKVRNIQWIGDDRVLIWWTNTYDLPLDLKNVHEIFTVVNVDLKAGTSTKIFAGSKKVADIVLGYAGSARIDGRDYGYFVGMAYKVNAMKTGYEFGSDQRNLYQVDFESNDVSKLARGGQGPSHKWIVDTDGTVMAYSKYDNKNGIWRLYAGDEKTKLLEKTDPYQDFALAGRGRTPGTVLIADNSTGETTTQEFSIKGGKSEPLFVNQSTDEYLEDPETGLLIGATTFQDPGALFFNQGLQARMRATRKAFPALQVKLVSFNHGLGRLIVKTDGGDDSGTFWLVDIATGNADPIGRPYHDILEADVGPTKWFTYKAADGLEIGAVLTLPPGRKPENLPLVVLPHGGPIGVSDSIGFDWWAQAFASAGYAVLQPNFRGSGVNGNEFIEAGYGQMGRKMQTDLSDGVAALSSKGIVNSKRVCIVGASYGGYAALAGVTLQKDIYRCAASVAGLSDLPAFVFWLRDRYGHESQAARYWRKLVGADKEGDGVMSLLSPARMADKASAPVLLVHGKDDTVVPIRQSEMMVSALHDAKKPVQFVEMQGEDHWLSRDETRKTMLKATVAFVRQHNPPD